MVGEDGLPAKGREATNTLTPHDVDHNRERDACRQVHKRVTKRHQPRDVSLARPQTDELI